LRINIYKQIRGFYSLVFESKFEFRPTHISLYMFLLNQNNRSNWTEWFKCPFDTVMMGACINSNKTYYSVLNDLQKYGLIKYKKGVNNYKAPQINIIPLQIKSDDSLSIPTPEQSSSVIFTKLTTSLTTGLSAQQCAQLDTQLSAQLSAHKDILLTNNFKLIVESTDNTVDEFKLFWDKYHLITKLNKSDKESAEKYWKKLTNKEKQSALDNVESYYNSLNDKKYCKKARTYLSDKNFNDEFKKKEVLSDDCFRDPKGIIRLKSDFIDEPQKIYYDR